jgi:hypothetical protein
MANEAEDQAPAQTPLIEMAMEVVSVATRSKGAIKHETKRQLGTLCALATHLEATLVGVVRGLEDRDSAGIICAAVLSRSSMELAAFFAQVSDDESFIDQMHANHIQRKLDSSWDDVRRSVSPEHRLLAEQHARIKLESLVSKKRPAEVSRTDVRGTYDFLSRVVHPDIVGIAFVHLDDAEGVSGMHHSIHKALCYVRGALAMRTPFAPASG